MSQTIRSLIAAMALAVSAPAVAQDVGSTGAARGSESPKAMIQGAKDALSEMSSASDAVTKNLESAERSGDVEAAECVRARLSKIDALIAVSTRAQSDMNTALAAVDQEARAEHEYRKIHVALTKTRQFRAEALTCQGDGAVADGQTEVTVDSNLDGGSDTLGLGISDGVVGIDPPGTTPFN